MCVCVFVCAFNVLSCLVLMAVIESVSQCVYCFHRRSSDTVWITEINDLHSGSAGENNKFHIQTLRNKHTHAQKEYVSNV